MTAIYARQSVDKKDSISIESQIEFCQSEVDGDFQVYQDKGFSGKNINRPAFEKMMQDVKSGIIKKIVVYRLDRFSRSIVDFGRIWETLQTQKVEFVSINEKFDTTAPMGRAMLHIIMVFAQLERETIAERIKDNYYQRAKQGAWLGGSPPVGFDIGREIGINGKRNSLLVPNEKIELVKHVFDSYANESVSLGKIAKELTDTNIPCMQKKAWDSVAVSRILHNPIYVMSDMDVYLYYKSRGVTITSDPKKFDGKTAGMIIGKRDRSAGKYNKVEEQVFALALHEGIISSDLWLKCQYKLEKNTQIKNTGTGKYTWLSGLLKCKHCGYSIKVVKAKNKLYFRCSGKTNYYKCDAKYSTSLADIETEIQNEIIRMFDDCTAEVPKNNSKTDMEQIQKNLDKIEDKMQRLIDALSEGNTITVKYINQELSKLEKEKQRILSEVSKSLSSSTGHQICGLDFARLDFEDKKAIAKNLIEKILIQDDDAEIIWKV